MDTQLGEDLIKGINSGLLLPRVAHGERFSEQELHMIIIHLWESIHILCNKKYGG